MEEPKSKIAVVLEFLILILFVISALAAVWGFYMTKTGNGCMDGMYLIYGLVATAGFGFLSLVITMVGVRVIRPIFRLIGLLPTVFIAGLIFISLLARLFHS